MEIVELSAGEVLVLGVKGRLDAYTSDDARNDLFARIDGPARVVLDLSKLNYVSSAGLRLFLEITKRTTAAGGKLALCAMVRNVIQVFELAGFKSFVPTYETQQEAIAAVT